MTYQSRYSIRDYKIKYIYIYIPYYIWLIFCFRLTRALATLIIIFLCGWMMSVFPILFFFHFFFIFFTKQLIEQNTSKMNWMDVGTRWFSRAICDSVAAPGGNLRWHTKRGKSIKRKKRLYVSKFFSLLYFIFFLFCWMCII